MADELSSRASAGGAIPSLYRRYLEAAQALALDDNPQAENELAEVVEALGRIEPQSLADISLMMDLYRDVASVNTDEPRDAADRIFRQIYVGVHRMVAFARERAKAAGGGELSQAERFALDVLRQVYTGPAGAPVLRTEWYAAHASAKKKKGHAVCSAATFSRTIDRLVRRGLVSEAKRGRFRVFL